MFQCLILLGAQEGPWCRIARVRNPALRVTGLERGTVTVYTEDAAGAHSHTIIGANGVHSLKPDQDWIRAEASDPTKNLICKVESRV